jgi:hypothetical protein
MRRTGDTSAAVELRAEQVATLLIQGKTKRHIVKFAQEQGWGVGDRSIDNYICKAKDLVKAYAEKEFEANYTLAEARLNDLYDQCYNAGDFGECRKIQEAINKLHGLDAPTKTDLTTKGQSITDTEAIKKAFLESLKINDPAE